MGYFPYNKIYYSKTFLEMQQQDHTNQTALFNVEEVNYEYPVQIIICNIWNNSPGLSKAGP